MSTLAGLITKPGTFVVLTGIGILVTVFARWAHGGFGALADEYPTALAITSVVTSGP